jgi:flagellar biosynthesis protein FlhG
MANGPTTKQHRAMVIAVCSGKGGVGKSTLAIFVASRLASAGKSTLLIDADFGIGDVATMTNQTPLVGFEQILAGEAKLEDAVLRFGPRLSIIGTLPGTHFEAALINEQGLANCRQIDSHYDIIVLDTPSTIDPLNLNLIAGSDLALSIITSRIPAIADSYVQLKRITQAGGKVATGFVVNQVESEAEGNQTIAKFGELVDRFLGHSIPALGIVEIDPRITKATESQSLLELTRQPGGFGRKAEKMIKTLLEKHISLPLGGCAIWEHLATTILLKTEVGFDDTRVLAGVEG